MKYSTHYVADGKGYRLVPHQGLITVYPKGGGEPRQASFVEYFNEDELKTANIRYFFPDGCQSPQIEIDKNYQAPVKATATTSLKVKPLETQKSTLESTDSSAREGDKNNYRSGRLRDFGGESDKEDSNVAKSGTINGEKSLVDARFSSDANKLVDPSVPTTGKATAQTGAGIHAHDAIGTNGGGQAIPSSLGQEISTVNGGAVTTSGAVHSRVTDETYLPPTSGGHPVSAGRLAPNIQGNIPSGALTVSPKSDLSNHVLQHGSNAIGKTPFKQLDNKCSDTCCDDNRPQLLMSRPSVGSCCKGVAKIIIPIEMDVLGNIPMTEILEITNETKNVEMLQKLLKLVEKYKL